MNYEASFRPCCAAFLARVRQFRPGFMLTEEITEPAPDAIDVGGVMTLYLTDGTTLQRERLCPFCNRNFRVRLQRASK